jgi:hypothetical protein
LKGEAASHNFRQCVSLINKVPVSWLKRHRDLQALSDVAQLVEDSLRRLQRLKPADIQLRRLISFT